MLAKLLVQLSALRRRWFLLRFRSKTVTDYGPGMTLSRFLLLNKWRYLDDVRAGNGKRWTVVMGNEAGGNMSLLRYTEQ